MISCYIIIDYPLANLLFLVEPSHKNMFTENMSTVYRSPYLEGNCMPSKSDAIIKQQQNLVCMNTKWKRDFSVLYVVIILSC